MLRKFKNLPLSLETYKAVFEIRSKKFSSKSEKNWYFFLQKLFTRSSSAHMECRFDNPAANLQVNSKNVSLRVQKTFAQNPKKRKNVLFFSFCSSEQVYWSLAKTSGNIFCRFRLLNFLCGTSKIFVKFFKKKSSQINSYGHAECSFVNPAENFLLKSQKMTKI